MGDENINLDAYYPRPYLNSAANQKNTNNPTTLYLQNAAYIRLQNVQIGYNLPVKVISKLGLQKLRVYFSGDNLLTLSKLPNYLDPLAIEGYNGNVGKTYAAERIFSFGITVTY